MWKRLVHYKEVLAIPVWKLGVWLFFDGFGAFLTYRDLLVSAPEQKKWHLDVLPHWDWGWWVIVCATAGVILIIEQSYKVRLKLERERDEAKSEVDGLRKRQVEALEGQHEQLKIQNTVPSKLSVTFPESASFRATGGSKVDISGTEFGSVPKNFADLSGNSTISIQDSIFNGISPFVEYHPPVAERHNITKSALQREVIEVNLSLVRFSEISDLSERESVRKRSNEIMSDILSRIPPLVRSDLFYSHRHSMDAVMEKNGRVLDDRLAKQAADCLLWLVEKLPD